MSQQTIVQEGAFDSTVREQINDNFTELYGSALAVDAIVGPSSSTDGDVVVFDGATGKLAQDTGLVAADIVTGPASVTDGKVAVFSGTTGKLIAADADGVSVGPFTTITSITVVNGLVTDLQGS